MLRWTQEDKHTYSAELGNTRYYVCHELDMTWTLAQYSLKPFVRRQLRMFGTQADAQAQAEQHAARMSRKAASDKATAQADAYLHGDTSK